jgi:DNA repair exonuclease SbcCD nuclease subunit
MNKIALLTDLHFGAREGSIIVLEHQLKFFKYFFQVIEHDKIDTLIILGDTFDTRKHTNNYISAQCKKYFFDILQERNINVYMIVGNHDAFFKNTLTPNTPSDILKEYNNINIIKSPQTVEVNGINIAMIPWICNDNYEESYEEIRSSLSDICMGHWEISGFQMYRGVESHGGLSPVIFDRYDIVLSGHYHHRSTQGNITYLGTSYEMTWQDYGDQKGFHIFDLETRQLEFIPNYNHLFIKLEYNDLDCEPIDLSQLDLSDTYIKLIVVNKTDYYKFDQFLNKLYGKGCIDIKIIEDLGEYKDGVIEDEISLEDTQSILNQYIDSIETSIDKDILKTFIQSLYIESINMEIA